MTSDIDYYRNKLEACVKKIPAGIATASVQKVRRYKDWYVKAQKTLGKRTSNQQAIASLISEYEGFL